MLSIPRAAAVLATVALLLIANHFRSPQGPELRSVQLDTAAVAAASDWTVAAIGHRSTQSDPNGPRAPDATDRQSCWHGVLASVAASMLTIVLTWSRGSATSAQRHYGGLRTLADAFAPLEGVRLFVDAKGSRCVELPQELEAWMQTGRVHCVQGPNMAAREAHTILRFLLEFYDFLPRALIFVQDDPMTNALVHIATKPTQWVRALEAAYDARANVTATGEAWAPSPCACSMQRGSAARKGFGHFRAVRWWLHAFIAGTGAARMPATLAWPRGAQLGVSRAAVRRRSRDFFARNAALASFAAPLKSATADQRDVGDGDACARHGWRNGRCVFSEAARKAKWRNFGPYVVDLGPLPRGAASADQTEALHGMNLALALERLWFVIFDPARREATPPHAACYTPAALAASPVRCGTRACEGAQRSGCAATDAAGETAPPPHWQFAPGRRRCLEEGCWSAVVDGVPSANTSLHSLPIARLLARVALPGGQQARGGTAQSLGQRVRVAPADLAPTTGSAGWVGPRCVDLGPSRRTSQNLRE